MTSQVMDGGADLADPPRTKEHAMHAASNANSSTVLRRILAADATTSGATGLLLIAAAAPLEGVLGLPAALLRGAGVVLLPFAAFVFSLARPAAPSPAGVRAVIAMNVAWVAASVLLLTSGPWSPTALGVAFVVGQAVVVALLAEAQIVFVRRAVAARAALA